MGQSVKEVAEQKQRGRAKKEMHLKKKLCEKASTTSTSILMKCRLAQLSHKTINRDKLCINSTTEG